MFGVTASLVTDVNSKDAESPIPNLPTISSDFQLPAVPPERPQMSTMLSSYEDSTAEPVQRRSRKAILGTALVLLLAAGAAIGLGSHKLADELRHSSASPETTPSAGSTPTSGLTGAKPHSTGGSGARSTTSSPARPATSSAHGQGKSQGTDGKANDEPPQRGFNRREEFSFGNDRGERPAGKW